MQLRNHRRHVTLICLSYHTVIVIDLCGACHKCSVPDIFANSHGSNDLLHCLFPLLLLLIVQLCLQFKDLP